LRQRGSDRGDRIGDAIGNTAHVLFVGLKNLSRTQCPRPRWAIMPDPTRCQVLLPIPPGGLSLSSPRG
jgi:hypothetical protein